MWNGRNPVLQNRYEGHALQAVAALHRWLTGGITLARALGKKKPQGSRCLN